MKYVLFALLFMLSNNLFSQQLNPKVNECITNLKKHTRNVKINSTGVLDNSKKGLKKNERKRRGVGALTTSEVNNKLQHMHDGKVKDLISLVHNAIVENPVYFEKQLREDAQKIEELYRKGENNNMKLYNFFTSFKHRVSKLYSKNYSEFLMTPIFLKVKINRIRHTVYSPIDSLDVAQTQIICSVEDILKGDKLFNTNDELSYYYNDFWRDSEVLFEENQEYLIGLSIVIKEDGSVIFPLILYSETQGVFKIENNLIDKNNFFGFGSNIDWAVFKKNFLNQFIEY